MYIKTNRTNNITINGTISVDGNDGNNATNGSGLDARAAGGGAGGGAIMLVGIEKISFGPYGKITANGGYGGNSGGWRDGGFDNRNWDNIKDQRGNIIELHRRILGNGLGGRGIAGGHDAIASTSSDVE